MFSIIKFWILQNLLAFDQNCNTLLGGWADETLSSRAYRTAKAGKVFGKFFMPIIDTLALLFGDTNHCRKAYLSEKFKRQLPPEARILNPEDFL